MWEPCCRPNQRSYTEDCRGQAPWTPQGRLEEWLTGLYQRTISHFHAQASLQPETGIFPPQETGCKGEAIATHRGKLTTECRRRLLSPPTLAPIPARVRATRTDPQRQRGETKKNLLQFINTAHSARISTLRVPYQAPFSRIFNKIKKKTTYPHSQKMLTRAEVPPISYQSHLIGHARQSPAHFRSITPYRTFRISRLLIVHANWPSSTSIDCNLIVTSLIAHQ